MKNFLIGNSSIISEWIRNKSEELNLEPALYSSVDVRESAFKIAPVDINLFSSGFNNFSDKLNIISDKFQKRLTKFEKNRVAIITENFTRNEKYLQNVEVLKTALEGISTKLDTLTINDQKIVDVNSQQEVSLENFDLIILNNDLSNGCPDVLLEAQDKVLPHPNMGWHKRRKYSHMQIYDKLVKEMVVDCDLKVDPWLLSTFTDQCDSIDFKNRVGIDALAEKVSVMLKQIEDKYREYEMNDCKPHVFIKANNGTFGMGIMVAYSADDILEMNKKTRHSMSTIKQGITNAELIIQEGVPSMIQLHSSTGEEVLYSVSGELLGKLIRYNPRKSDQQNLNSVGMDIAVSDNIDAADHIISALVNITTQIETSTITK